MIFEANEYPPCFSREAWEFHEDTDVSAIIHVTAWPGLFNRLANNQENDNA